jgi:hypothetical protein
MTMIAGCGSEVSVMLPLYYESSPAITNFHYTQDVVNSYVDGTVAFYAPDSDLGSITITVVNSRGAEISRTITSLGAVAGRSSGTIPVSIDYINYRPDDYTFTIYLTDRAGYVSNPVYGSFRI